LTSYYSKWTQGMNCEKTLGDFRMTSSVLLLLTIENAFSADF